MKTGLTLLGIVLLLYSSISSALTPRTPQDIPHLHCMMKQANDYNIALPLLVAIIDAESSFNSKAINKRKNGRDVGYAQISSSWFSMLKKSGITESDLIHNPCLNIQIAAWLISKNFQTHGISWNSIGAYNAGFKKENAGARKKYSDKIKNKYKFYVELFYGNALSHQ